jgi:hypothetical protein
LTDVDALFAAGTARTSYVKCWAQRINGPAKELLDRLTEHIADGGYVNKSALERVFHNELGVSGDIARHFRGDCRCPK